MEKKGVRSRARYRVSLEARPDGNRFVRFDDVEVLSVEGINGDLPPQTRTMFTLMSQALPGIVVSPEGHFVEAEGYERILPRLLAHVPPEARPQVEVVFSRPEMATMYSNQIQGEWNAWVGAWTDLDLQPGEEREGVVEQSLPSGDVLPVETRLERSRRDDGLVEVTLVTQLEGTALNDAIRPMIAGLLGRDQLPDELDELNELSLERITIAEALIEPNGIRPLEVKTEMRIQAVIPNRSTRTRVDRKTYRFDWKSAEGCV